MVDMTVLGISLQGDGNTPVLLLFPHSTKGIISIPIGPLAAFAISTALSEAEADAGTAHGDASAAIKPEDAELFSRPLIHDFLLRSFQGLGGKLASVEILSDSEQSPSAQVVLDSPKGEIRLDCRPSDGIALAIRSGAPVRGSLSLVARAEDALIVMPTLSDDMRTIVAAKLLALQDDKGLAPIRDDLLAFALKPEAGAKGRGPGNPPDKRLIKEGLADDILSKALSEARKQLVAPSAQGEKAASPTAEGQQAAKGSPHITIEKKQDVDTALPERGNAALSTHTGNTAEPEEGEAELEAVVAPGQTIVLPGPKVDGKSPTIRISLVRQPVEGKPEVLDEFLFPSSGIPKEVLGTLSLSQDEVKAVGNASSEEDRWTTLLKLLSPATKVPM